MRCPPRPLALLALLCALPAVAAPAPAPPLEGEAAVVQALLARAPAVHAARAQVGAAKAAAVGAGTRPDPMVMLGVMNLPTDSLQLADEEMAGWTMGVERMINPPSMRAAAQGLAAARVERSAAEVAVVERALSIELRRTYWRWVAAALEAQDLRAELGPMDALAASVEARSGQGLEMGAAAAMVRLERGGMEDMALAMEAEAAGLRAQLEARAGGPLSLALPAALPRPSAPPPLPAACASAAAAPADPALQAIDPMLGALSAMADEERAMADEARAAGRRAPTVQAELLRRAMEHEGMSRHLLTVGVAVPLGRQAADRARAEEAAARSRGQAADLAAAAAAEEACAMARMAHASAAAALTRAHNQRHPRVGDARALEQLAFAAYQAGTGALRDLLDAAALRRSYERAERRATLDFIEASLPLWEVGALERADRGGAADVPRADSPRP
ncbi:MAG: hypothetical protein JNM72_20565 [Deltaproteobacteria bacterium]|nr:hypothetical protein [Deltaproteobacteria bacterium]